MSASLYYEDRAGMVHNWRSTTWPSIDRASCSKWKGEINCWGRAAKGHTAWPHDSNTAGPPLATSPLNPVNSSVSDQWLVYYPWQTRLPASPKHPGTLHDTSQLAASLRFLLLVQSVILHFIYNISVSHSFTLAFKQCDILRVKETGFSPN